MTREAMTEMLSETICVTHDEARAALEASEWRILDAAQKLQLDRRSAERAARMSRRDGGHTLRGLFRRFTAAAV